jgi:hypothetical protein
MVRAIEMGWFILDKYYNMTDQVPVYAAALLLDPQRRAAHIKKNWPEEWYEPALNSAITFWEEGFDRSFRSDTPTALEAMPPPPKKKKDNQLALLMKEMEVVTTEAQYDDDFQAFIEAPTFRIDCNPLQWWCRSEQRQRYPKLSHMAITILSIPAESSEPERVFSGARRTCSWDRFRLRCHNIEKIECIGNWLREKHIEPLADNGMGFPMEADAEDEGEGDDDDLDVIEWE